MKRSTILIGLGSLNLIHGILHILQFIQSVLLVSSSLKEDNHTGLYAVFIVDVFATGFLVLPTDGNFLVGAYIIVVISNDILGKTVAMAFVKVGSDSKRASTFSLGAYCNGTLIVLMTS